VEIEVVTVDVLRESFLVRAISEGQGGALSVGGIKERMTVWN
jgi:hypothetical protein